MKLQYPIHVYVHRFLYRVVPVKAWQAFWLDRHFSKCPVCREAFSVEEPMDSIGITPAEAQLPADLWARIEKRIDAAEAAKDNQKRWGLPGPIPMGKRKWVTPLMAAAAVSILFLVIPLTVLIKGPHQGTGERYIEVRNREIIIRSIKVDDGPARVFYFQPEREDRVIVWVKKAGNEK